LTPETAEALVADESNAVEVSLAYNECIHGLIIQAVSFGQGWIGNPDFYKRAQKKAPMNENDPKVCVAAVVLENANILQTFYATPDAASNAKGYTDYPALEGSAWCVIE
jgi:hypothetical protein